MSAPPPRSRPVPPALPPMPRRQSCDRCHEQKVRCFTDGHENALGLRGIAEEDETHPGAHVVSALPCVRCRKAGTLCIYSPQLRSGRPRLQRDPAAQPARKRARKASRCSSSSPSLSPTLSQSSSPPPTALTFASSNISIGSMDRGANSTPQERLARQITPILSPVVVSSHHDQGPKGGQELEQQQRHQQHSQQQHAVPDQWLMSHFASESAQYQASLCQLDAFSQATVAPAIPCVPLFSDPAPPTTTPTENVVSQFNWSFPDPSENFAEEAAQINLRVHRATRALTPLTRTLLSVSSPAVNEIFDSTCSLINLIDRYAVRRATAPIRLANGGVVMHQHQHHGVDGVGAGTATVPGSFDSAWPPASQNALDTTICLMILACHQGLLGVFEDFCASFLVYIAELQKPTSPRTPSGASFFSSSSTQLIVMVNLISHLLSQLDRAIGSLAGSPGPPQTSGQHDPLLPVSAPSPDSSSSSEGAYDHNLFGLGQDATDTRPDGQSRRVTERQKATASIFDQIEQRQQRVRSQVKTVKRLLRGSNVL